VELTADIDAKGRAELALGNYTLLQGSLEVEAKFEVERHPHLPGARKAYYELSHPEWKMPDHHSVH
jgi:hypothetical protein